MKSKCKNRWLIAGSIWLAALGMTYWNYNKIDAVAATRTKIEQLHSEKSFQQRHAKKLSQISQSHEAFFLPVESLQLGLVTIHSDLYALSAAFDLHNVRLQNQTAQATQEQIPINLMADGQFDKTLEFLAALHKYPYLPVKHAWIKAVPAKFKVEIVVELDFQFKIKSLAEPGNWTHDA